MHTRVFAPRALGRFGALCDDELCECSSSLIHLANTPSTIIPSNLSFISLTMLSRVALRTASRVSAPAVRLFSVEKAMTAEDALARSGYKSIDYTINEEATVYDAVHKFAAFNIGCLVTVDGSK